MSHLVSKKSVIACLKQDAMAKTPPLFDRIEAALPEPSLPTARATPRHALRIPRFVPACAACIAVCILVLPLFPPRKNPSANSARAVGAASPPSGYSSVHEMYPSSNENVAYAGASGSIQKSAAQSGSDSAGKAASSPTVGSNAPVLPGSPVNTPQTSGAVSGASGSQVSTLTFAQAEKKGNSVTSSISVPAFISYNDDIYRADYTAAGIEKLQKEYIGEQLTTTDSDFPYYAVQGVSSDQEIAMQIGSYYIPCTYLCPETVSFNGITYRVGSPGATSLHITESNGKATPTNGKYIGMAGTLPAYSIDGIDESKQIAVNLTGDMYADAVKQ